MKRVYFSYYRRKICSSAIFFHKIKNYSFLLKIESDVRTGIINIYDQYVNDEYFMHMAVAFALLKNTDLFAELHLLTRGTMEPERDNFLI